MAITAALAKFEDNEEAWIQHVVRPAHEKWHRKSERYIQNMKSGGSQSNVGQAIKAFWTPPTNTSSSPVRMVDYDQARVDVAETKSQKLAYETAIRIVYRGNVPSSEARLRIKPS